MLSIHNQEYFDKVKAFAESTGCMEQLQSKLDYLGTYGNGPTKCVLGWDFAPNSFSFVMMQRDEYGEYRDWFHGGLIFNSQGTWSVHT